MSISFTDEQKIKMFDLIASKFYERNFGSCTKADFELLMFHFFLENINSEARGENGVLDFKKCSDYVISQQLGITQERVRSLKIKKQLIYPHHYDWKVALADLVCNARYDEKKKEMVINIPDPNLFYDIQNFIESEGGYVDIQLNTKILKIRVEYYIQLAMHIENESNKKKIIKNLKKKIAEERKEEVAIEEKNIGELLMKMPELLIKTIDVIASVSSGENFLISALKLLLQKH